MCCRGRQSDVKCFDRYHRGRRAGALCRVQYSWSMVSPGASANLLYQLALRDFRQRYVGSLLGWLWGVIHPLVLLAVYTFLFRHAFGARLPSEELTESYPLFLLAGLLPWLVFAET